MLRDLVLANRSYRGYDRSRRVTQEELRDMVDCARLTASTVNSQPLKFYLAYTPGDVDAVAAHIKWAKGLPEISLPHPGKEPTAYIVIFQDKRVHENLSRYQRDCGIVAQTILLRAAEMGLGGCMIGSIQAEGIRTALHQPEYLAPLLVVAVGKPDETVVLTEISEGESYKYYRDAQDVHYVPKRKLEDILL